MKAKMRKATALFLCIFMIASMVPIGKAEVHGAVSEEETMEIVAQYDMSHQDGYLTDVSGNENHATLVGMTDSDFHADGEDTVLVFDGSTDKYVTLPSGLIETERFSIEAEFIADKTGSSGENSWLFCLGTEVNSWPNVKNYLFLCPAQGNNGNNSTGNMRAGIKDSSSEILLGQSQAIVADEYNVVKMAFDNGTLTLSLNGTEVETISTGYSIQEILSAGTSGNAIGYIGKSLYSPDPAFSGKLKNMTIYAAKQEVSSEEPIASYSFDSQTLENGEASGNPATAVITGLTEYSGEVSYEEGITGNGYAVRIGDYGLKLNEENIGKEYTVSFWVNLDKALAENQVIAFMGYHSPENWLALSGDTSNYKFWGKGGIFTTWTTLASPAIEAGSWHNLTFSGKEGKVTAYLDGKSLGTFNSNDPLDGENQDIYLGVNNWDAEAVGLIDDVKVYNVTLTPVSVKAEYQKQLLKMADANLDLGDTSGVKEDLNLPGFAEYGAAVTWATSDETVITADGKVTRPAEGENAAAAILTAALTLEGNSVTKEFQVTVLPWNVQEDLKEAEAALVLPEVITENITLPTEGKYGSSIAWETSDGETLTADGTILKKPAVGEGNEKVTMTATITLQGQSVTKSFEVEVMEEFYGYILSYITGNDDLTGSLHLAYSTDGTNFNALNSNSGILFATIDTNNTNKNLSTGIRYQSPYLFRKADGTFGFAATQNDSSTSIYMYDSEDLITYTGERLAETNSTVGNPLSPEVKYDAAIGAYRINWINGDGIQYSSITKDLQTLEMAQEYTYEEDTSVDSLDTIPDGAIAGNVIPVTKAEYDKIVKKLGVVTNTGVEELENLVIDEGQDPELPKTITAYYSDGSTTEMNITWDTDGIDFSEAGVYTVNGTIDQELYANPLIEQRADPQIKYDEEEGCYYFTASYPAYNNVNSGYDRIILRKSDTIAGLSDAEEITIWTAPSSGTMAKHVWAPEIHKINGKWYVFFAAGNSDNIWAIRPYVLVCQNNADPYDPDSWVQSSGSAEVHAATSLDSAYFQHMSLDMTYFEHNGKHYVIWADIIGQSALYMQEIDPDAPWTGISEKVICLTTPEYGWERDTERVNEGASVIKHDGKIYVTFSASGTGPEYCIGLLSADENADLMDEDSWIKTAYPVLTSSDVPGEYGPGHNSFTVDENGNAIFVYHARSEECYNNQCAWANSDSLYDPCRHARVKRVHWAADGTPILNMTYEEELNEAYVNVAVTVTVKDSEEKELKILENPADYEGTPGENAIFTVEAEGEGLTYQWQYSNVNSSKWYNSSMPGNQETAITVTVANFRDGQKYRCIVTDKYGNSLTSEVAVIAVCEDGSLMIVTQPVDYVGQAGEDAVFTVEAEGEGLTYQWQYSNVNSSKWYNSSMPGNQETAITVTVANFRNGQKYRCVVTDKYGNSLTSEAAVISVCEEESLVIVTQPVSYIGQAGDTAKFVVVAEGINLTYEWQYCNVNSTVWRVSSMKGNHTAVLAVPVTELRDGQKYRCVITSESGKQVITEVVTVNISSES